MARHKHMLARFLTGKAQERKGAPQLM